MRKDEFLEELKISLTGQLTETDINEILSDYNDIFDDGILEHGNEDEASKHIGSPAAISKAIINDYTHHTTPPIAAPDTTNLSPISKRLLAHLLDTTLIMAIFMMLFMITGTIATSTSNTVSPAKEIVGQNQTSGTSTVISTYSYSLDRPSSSAPMVMTLLLLIPPLLFFMALGLANMITAFELWLFKGYTFGKWITKIRVVKSDGSKLTFWDALLRDGVLKCVASIATSGLLNMFSFVWACATPEHKTIHDLVTKTKVINITR